MFNHHQNILLKVNHLYNNQSNKTLNADHLYNETNKSLKVDHLYNNQLSESKLLSDDIKLNNLCNQNDQIHKFEKPNLSYIALISEAINSKSNRKTTLKEIYQFIINKYPYYNQNQSRWQNSVRHNLSLNRCFIRLPSKDLTNKSSYWTIRKNIDDSNESTNRKKIEKKFKNNQLIVNNQMIICQSCKLNCNLNRQCIQTTNNLKFSIKNLINQ